MRHYLVVLLAFAVFLIPWMSVVHPDGSRALLSSLESAGGQFASVVFSHDPKTVGDIELAYKSSIDPRLAAAGSQKKVRILIVPGHEPDQGGAQFLSLKERDMTVELGQDLQALLENDPHFQVYITRDTKNWNPIFESYFRDHWEEIKSWVQAHKDEVISLERLGQFVRVAPSVLHNDTPYDGAIRLYGIDKWVDDNGIDIVIHIHFNDYPGHALGVPGRYSGFAIYVPQREFDNSTTSRALADSVFQELSKYNKVSDLPGESSGVVQDQDLIAVGAYNSVDAASMLIEYGYIYEPQFINGKARRSAALESLAEETYRGIQDFFASTTPPAPLSSL
ncbi:MAG: N-acetylmuramoyl-L-alanine amidase [Patescibacteria group bacterium]|nr:N-acetylmuramoyl-L-alanine amidase [Patescibacteria group bacterium]MDE1940498.1 N-acetylmuramoyl-L-alanine amidase [Patescibacteria group bacterium]MDE1966564.1 N-acetylmuramoyl-L-alanine amidase [Patescibacteria group bacterium]